MEMSNKEIVHRFVDLETPISILAELNAVSNDTIRDVLKAEGVDIASGRLKVKRHIVDPKPSKPYQGENKTRKPYTKSGLYTKEAKEARKKGNKDLKKVLENNGYKVNSEKTNEEEKKMPVKKSEKAAEPQKAAESQKVAVPEINETLKNLVFARLNELEVKMGYHQEQIRQYEIEYAELLYIIRN